MACAANNNGDGRSNAERTRNEPTVRKSLTVATNYAPKPVTYNR